MFEGIAKLGIRLLPFDGDAEQSGEPRKEIRINELVTNAAKHAYPGGSGEIRVSGEHRGQDLHVEISDQGVGLPKDFDIDQPRASLGFKVIKSLVGQLDARITLSATGPKGATIQLDVPLDSHPS